jgi:hypothetical protein
MAKQGSNKSRNQLRAGGTINATWLEKNKAKRRRANKIANLSRRFNRKK